MRSVFLDGAHATGVEGYAPLVSPARRDRGQQRAAAYAARYCAFIITYMIGFTQALA